MHLSTARTYDNVLDRIEHQFLGKGEAAGSIPAGSTMKNNDIPSTADGEFANKSLAKSPEPIGFGDMGEDCSVAAVRARALAYLAKREAEKKAEEPEPPPAPKIPQAPSTEGATFVYVAASKVAVKIGYAHNLYLRFSNLQTGSHMTFTLEGYREMPKAMAKDVERFVHMALKDQHIKGEWFDVEPAVALGTINRVTKLVSELYGVLPPEGDTR